MIVTDRFVYIHVSRHGGTFINRMMLNLIPGARMIGYHYQLAKLPVRFRHLPVISFVRNPWDWYVSMFHDYARKSQPVFLVLSENKTLAFKETVKNFLLLGSGTPAATRHLEGVTASCPAVIDKPLKGTPALEKHDFEGYPDMGYYSWLWRRMHTQDGAVVGEFGRFEDLRPELLRLLRSAGSPISSEIERYVEGASAANSTTHDHYRDYYDEELRDLVGQKERFVIERFGYTF